jgi:hypothetical protein
VAPCQLKPPKQLHHKQEQRQQQQQQQQEQLHHHHRHHHSISMPAAPALWTVSRFTPPNLLLQVDKDEVRIRRTISADKDTFTMDRKTIT